MDPSTEDELLMEMQCHQQQQSNNRKYLSYCEENSNYVTVDSAYGSGYNISSSTPNKSLTPHRNNSNAIRDSILSSVKLTPVTQNINRICNFHITTPKSNDFVPLKCNDTVDINCGDKISLKRSSELLNQFDNLQSTPKKFKSITTNDNFKVHSTNSTPRKPNQRNSINKIFRHKLHSAPDLDAYFENNENFLSPSKVVLSTIEGSPNKIRTPLAHSNYQQSSSTPIVSTANNFLSKLAVKTASVNKLLNCSNEEFDNLLKSGEKPLTNIDKKDHHCIDTSLSEMKTCYGRTKPFCYDSIKKTTLSSAPATAPSKAPFRRVLSFANEGPTISGFMSPTNLNRNSIDLDHNLTTNVNDVFHTETNHHSYKKLYPNVNTVLNDRLMAKKRAIAARLADFGDDSDSSNYSPERKKISPTPISRWELPVVDMELSPLQRSNNKFDDNLNVEEIICDRNTTQMKSDNNSVKTILYRSCSSDMEISPLKSPDNLNVVPSKSVQKIINRNVRAVTPPKRKISFEDEVISSNENDKQHHTLLPKTPRKSQSIDYEKYEILYPTIPITPRKKSHHLYSPKKKQSDRRNTQYNNYKKFYDGAIYLNIIGKLETIPIILDRIFEYLSSRDLLNLTMSTKTYRRIVQSNLIADRRLQKFLEEYKISKENYCRKNVENIYKKTAPIIINNNNNNMKKLPFTQNNTKLDRKRSLDIIAPCSPPVSPSKKTFYDHQKIVKTLSESDCLVRCPRCAKASRLLTNPQNSIHNTNEKLLMNDSKRNSLNTFQTVVGHSNNEFNDDINGNTQSLFTIKESKSMSLSKNNMKLIKSASVDSGFQITNRIPNYNHHQNELLYVFEPYGECMNTRCKFIFCMNCNCEYHPGSKCKVAPISPSKEDEQDGIYGLYNSPKSKNQINRNTKLIKRKSLKRLCF